MKRMSRMHNVTSACVDNASNHVGIAWRWPNAKLKASDAFVQIRTHVFIYFLIESSAGIDTRFVGRLNWHVLTARVEWPYTTSSYWLQIIYVIFVDVGDRTLELML